VVAPLTRSRPAQLRVIELAEAYLEARPVDQPGEPHQRMAQVEPW
jgi:hypothetical protein